MHPLLNIAVGAARRAGEVIVRSLDRVGALVVSEKGRNDFVSEVDRAAEQAVIAAIRKAYPSHGFLAEESGATAGDEYTWVIDPLDGTTNFLHGFPQFAVAVACRHRGRAEVGVVLDPLRNELFTAERGAGAQLDGRRVRVSQRAGLDGALVGTGFPYRENRRWLKSYMAMLEVVMQSTAGVRRPGAASLDLAYVAAGRLDAFWEFGLSPWDTAAGNLLITEAGGRVGNLAGGEYADGGNLLAGSPKVFAALAEMLAPFLDDELRK
ncbi:MAG TPA: inositol monophosphatase family protein [Steroidobacteraceae bacterium]|nr:inositol monophosphatase family protein [Steroidobacteraceae bacterium]